MQYIMRCLTPGMENMYWGEAVWTSDRANARIIECQEDIDYYLKVLNVELEEIQNVSNSS